MSNADFKQFLQEVQYKVGITPKNAVEQRKLSKNKYSFSGQSLSEQLVIWDYIWNHSPDIWTRIQAYLFLELHMKNKNFLSDSWETIKHWQQKVADWGSCDALSKIYTKILEIIPDNVLVQLRQWNKSANPWDRRQSVVSLLYFSRTKKVLLPYDTIIPLIANLLEDEEYYVQKAVGWSLRELYHVYPLETLHYLNENFQKVSATAFAAATEKLKKEDKEKLKMRRKNRR